MKTTRALVIDRIARENIERVIKYAFDHKIKIEVMRKMVTGEVVAPGYSPNYTCEIFNGYRVVLSIEEHPMGWCRHISISVDGGLLPSIEAAKLIIKEFGFESPLENCVTRIEEIPDDIERPQAIEVIEPIRKI
jgi:hypothetical protein